jgi:hypothetical protein
MYLPDEHITIYVESDGRHVAAISASGHILWVRDPFSESGLRPYRNNFPTISELRTISPQTGSSRPHTTSIGVEFDSSQAGTMSIEDGKFTDEAAR